MGDERINQFDGELAAIRHQRDMESLGASTIVNKALDATGSLIEKLHVPGAGLFRKALKSGETPVETLVDQLEAAALDEIHRIWKHIEGQDDRLRHFEARLQSQEALSAYRGAILHGLRTFDPAKRARLGALTIRSVYENELEPESLDGLMRAAVELRESDLSLLRELYRLWKPLLERAERAKEATSQPPNFHSEIQTVWSNFRHSLDPAKQLEYRGSFTRLQSHGMIQQVVFGNNEVGREPYVLLNEGARFYERLQEIGTVK